MPSPNTLKTYIENGFYHVYNRGVEKRHIFQDHEDYTKFLYLLKIYLSPFEILHQEYPLLRINIINNNLHGKLDLLAFCLMPNHFHLLLHQQQKDAITKFMRQIITAYAMHFNKRHQRVGPLFQSVFKAAQVDSDEYLLHLSRYIHLNPLDRGASLSEFQWSSYLNYLGEKQEGWLKTDFITAYFNQKNPKLSYKNFVEESIQPAELPPDILIEKP